SSFPRLPGQKFEDPPFEEEIISFIRNLGHTREIKVLTDVNINYMHQPWRSFADIINSEETESDNDGDDFTHPNLSTYKAYDKKQKKKKKLMMMKYLLIRECIHRLTINSLMKKKIKKAMTRLRKVKRNKMKKRNLVQHQISSVSSDLVSKFINPSLDTDIPNFASLFQFDQRVSTLETEMSEFKQTNQFVEAISSIPGIVDNYLASKMKDAVDVAVQLQTNKQAQRINSSQK
nr:hypothetical protein [Tanacetum cinerariifolium]